MRRCGDDGEFADVLVLLLPALLKLLYHKINALTDLNLSGRFINQPAYYSFLSLLQQLSF